MAHLALEFWAMRTKPRIRAYRRDDRDGMYCYKDSVTGERESLETKDAEEAKCLVSHKNEPLRIRK